MTYMIDDCLCSFSKTIFLMTLCAKMSDTMTFQKKHISTTPAPAGASETRPTGSAPRHSERAPSDTAAAPAATRAPWAAGPTTAAAARDSWGPLSRRVSAATPGGLGVHLHPVITCHHMSSHVTAAQRSFGGGWFWILGFE